MSFEPRDGPGRSFEFTAEEMAEWEALFERIQRIISPACAEEAVRLITQYAELGARYGWRRRDLEG